MIHKLLPALLFFAIFTSCDPVVKYVPVTEFNVNETALPNTEPVKLLYVNLGYQDVAGTSYYTHLVVKSQITGDTINILSKVNREYTEADYKKEFYFISESIVAAYLSNQQIKDGSPLTPEQLYENNIKRLYFVANDIEPDKLHSPYKLYSTVYGGMGLINSQGGVEF